jgi:hypothetical protein
MQRTISFSLPFHLEPTLAALSCIKFVELTSRTSRGLPSGIRMVSRGKRHVENRRRLVGLALDAKAAVLRTGGPCLQSIVSCLETALVV